MYKKYTMKIGMPNRHINKICLIMRLTTVILMATFLHVSAASLAQKVTLNQKNTYLEKIFRDIHNQTGYDFLYDKVLLEAKKPVSLSITEMPLEEALAKFLDPQGLTFTIDDRTIFIKERKKTLLTRLTDALQSIDIRGRVLDENGIALPGASVRIIGTNRSVVSDGQGNFVLSDVDVDAYLEISYVGYKTIKIMATPNLTVRLNTIAKELDELVVNKGYYTESQRLATGNSIRITAKDIEKQPVTNPLLALQGRVPGLQITQVSGVANSPVNVIIRGRSSLNQAVSNNPLYVIDGIPYQSVLLLDVLGNNGGSGVNAASPQGNPLNYINPNDIASIDVLKDADATAIYGSRGGNGVILITTKKGTPGKLSFSANLSQGLMQAPQPLELMNTQQYLQMRREAFKNDGLAVPSILTTPNDANFDVNGTWDTERYTDWQKELIGGSASYTNLNMSVSGGSESIQYGIRGTFNRQGALYPGGFDNKKAALNFNVTAYSSNRKLKLDFSANLLNDYNLNAQSDLTRYTLRVPNAPKSFNDDGTLNFGGTASDNDSNPYAYMLRTYNNKTNNTIISLRPSYKIAKGLTASANLGYTDLIADIKTLLPSASYSPLYLSLAPPTNHVATKNRQKTWIVEPQLSYDYRINKLSLSALLGTSFQESDNQGNYVAGSNYVSDQLIGNIANAGTITIADGGSFQYNYNAVYARFNANLAEKYVLNLTGRRDGSSKFGPGNQFGNFYSVGAAWIFSSENFVRNNLTFLTLGKLRASYGVTGNDGIANYAFYDLYTRRTNTYQGLTGFVPSGLANPDVSWEKNAKLEFGLDLNFLKDRIGFSGSYYRNTSSNQLLSYRLPAITGFSAINNYNFPATVENSGWEAILNTQNLILRNFRWSSSFNISINRNKLIKFENLATSSYASSLEIGQPVTGRQLAWISTGIDPMTGLYTVLKKDGGSGSTAGDFVSLTNPTYESRWMNTLPKFFGGFNNTFQYKNFQLDVLLQFVKQTGRLSIVQNLPGLFSSDVGSSSSAVSNVPVQFLDRWQKPGDQAKYQRFSQSTAGRQAYSSWISSDAVYVDASYIRLKNISLSYQLPARLKERLKLKNSSINVSGQNLFTITPYQGRDPETQELSTLPPLRVIVLGLQFTL
ncbi:SusC/RagA family TonB-linked outer membrane protein [Pedobacter psychrodurus]|uniref:SusC/RagA family TonB-linked outer membrane protein n=1 Tax=Pedobacter psychrodurus TaxID=2530456 RepID=A0A4R0Q766_9SPHI|nr:SusC/RagA family TonB-linked outer membrane protein [Pedobacter psychrodurus]TCD28715.1 SusC/RagA family TonB-linked outer membrane protein [Pedobacter psychrodurus]